MPVPNFKEALQSKIPKTVSDAFNDMFEIEKDSSIANEKSSSLEMEFNRMKPFPGHLFKLYKGQQLDDMIESIKHFGILVPIILWHNDSNAYIILSGHNRVNAGKLAGLTKGPVIVKEKLTQDEAVLIVTETNLRQRSFSDMSHSERSFCLAQHYSAIKSQGKRNDLINEIETLLKPHDDKVTGACAEVQHKQKSRDVLAQDYGLSRDKVAKYIRLSTLISSLLSYVDTGEIAFLAAYDISFIEDKDKQSLIVDFIKRDGCKINMEMAALLREYYENKKLTDKAVEEILSGEKTRKPKNDKPKEYKVKPAVIKKYFTKGQSQTEIENTIDKALEMYFAGERSG